MLKHFRIRRRFCSHNYSKGSNFYKIIFRTYIKFTFYWLTIPFKAIHQRPWQKNCSEQSHIKSTPWNQTPLRQGQWHRYMFMTNPAINTMVSMAPWSLTLWSVNDTAVFMHMCHCAYISVGVKSQLYAKKTSASKKPKSQKCLEIVPLNFKYRSLFTEYRGKTKPIQWQKSKLCPEFLKTKKNNVQYSRGHNCSLLSFTTP